MQSDHDALFRAILASPDDDPLRLVFADWLEEFGDPQHAHFVRVQVANAELPPWDPAWIRANWIDRTTGYPNDFSVPYVRLPEGLSWQGGMYRRGFPSAAQTLMDSPLADRLTYLRLVMNKIGGPMKRKLRRRMKERVVY